MTTTDLQHVAQMLQATRRDDQITAADAHRLDEIALYGFTKGDPPPINTMTVTNLEGQI